MHIAITGATGFLGRYLLKHFAAGGHRLRCWHRPGSDRSGLEPWAEAVTWVPGSLGEAAAIAPLLQGVEAVVHSALDWQRQSGFRFSAQQDQDRFLEVNLMGSLRLFQAAHAAGVPRFVFISTCAVHEVILDDRPLDETHPLWPTSHYGAHKAALEKFVHSYGLGQGWPICALRPTGIYGLAHPPAASRWYDLVGQVLRGEPIDTAKGGKEVHAADVAKAADLLLCADAKTVAGQAYNCCDRYIAEREVARIARELSGSASTIADVNRGPKHQIDTRKLRGLGMQFGGETLLRQTVAELVAAWRPAA
ncbi:MAG: NAD(P)-dependent oxidoreductase [Planctomycetia bacterium]|nr:NAD(P)-dependent oxidoreductase [Planctomycetia bacterium]